MRKVKQKLGTLLSGVKRNGKLDLLAVLMLLGRMKTEMGIRRKKLYGIFINIEDLKQQKFYMQPLKKRHII